MANISQKMLQIGLHNIYYATAFLILKMHFSAFLMLHVTKVFQHFPNSEKKISVLKSGHFCVGNRCKLLWGKDLQL